MPWWKHLSGYGFLLSGLYRNQRSFGSVGHHQFSILWTKPERDLLSSSWHRTGSDTSLFLFCYHLSGRYVYRNPGMGVRRYRDPSDAMLGLGLRLFTLLPERGDQIDVSFDGAPTTFEVLGQDGIPPWEFSDPHQQVLRIHTKKVA